MRSGAEVCVAIGEVKADAESGYAVTRAGIVAKRKGACGYAGP
jgi:hypothetical protein